MVAAGLVLGSGYVFSSAVLAPVQYVSELATGTTAATSTEATSTPTHPPVWPALLDTADYDQRLLTLAHYQPPASTTTTTIEHVIVGTTTVAKKVTKIIPPASPLRHVASDTNVTIAGKDWPTPDVYPNGGALLPFYRILAYYGNFYSPRMGILGEYDKDAVLARLASTTAMWDAADPTTPVMPAIQYIAMVAQGSAGADGAYRAVMPDSEIEKAYAMAKEAHGVLFVDLQVGLSTIEKELPQFEKYLKRPDVHLAIDPEFSMKYGQKPGTVIGTYDAKDINYVINWLSDIVKENHLPPKVLVVHRFTQAMVTNYQAIKPTPEVQVVINMDGWGSKQLKRGTYRRVIEPEPVQFTGVKIFYKNDLKPPSTGLLTPAEVLQLNPRPVYVQYQ